MDETITLNGEGESTLWREAYCAAISFGWPSRTCLSFADNAVRDYRVRVK